MEQYTALLMDVTASRRYDDAGRLDIQRFMMQSISVLNTLFSASLRFEVVFSAGDELQGLFCSPEAAYLYYRLFAMLVFPVGIRAGIGVGEWSVQLPEERSTAQDGPAYHRARGALELTRDSLGYRVLYDSDSVNDLFINSLLNASSELVQGQSSLQNQLYVLSEALCPIVMNDAFDTEQMKEVGALFARKSEFGYYAADNRAAADQVPGRALRPVDALAETSRLYITSGKLRGVPGVLSEMLGRSRQSVDESMRSGNIVQARNLTISALRLMEKSKEGML